MQLFKKMWFKFTMQPSEFDFLKPKNICEKTPYGCIIWMIDTDTDPETPRGMRDIPSFSEWLTAAALLGAHTVFLSAS